MWISALLKTFRETGCVNKKGYPHERVFRKLTVPLDLTIIHLVLSCPGIYLKEIQVELREAMEAEIGPSAICRFLHKVGFSRQRINLVALQSNKKSELSLCQMFQFIRQKCLYF